MSLQNRRTFFVYFVRTEAKARRARSASRVRGKSNLALHAHLRVTNSFKGGGGVKVAQ